MVQLLSSIPSSPYDISSKVLEQAKEEMKDKTGYYSVYDAINETREKLVIDLSKYVLRLPKEYEECLKPAPEGIYMFNEIEPILTFEGKGYFSSKQLQLNSSVPDLTNFEQVVNHHGPVYDNKANVVFVMRPELKRSISKQPIYNRSAIYLMVISIYSYFARLGRGFSPLALGLGRGLMDVTGFSRDVLCTENFVKESHLEDYDEYLNADIDSVMSKIMDFIGNDTMSLYRLSLQNAVLCIDKGNDIRVIEYTRLIHEHLQSIASHIEE